VPQTKKEEEMAKKSAEETFMDEAERIVQQYANQNKSLTVWRGQYENQSGSSKLSARDTIIVGLSDNKNLNQTPDISIMVIYLNFSAQINFHTGSENDTSQSCPFGGGHSPIKEVTELAKKLPNII